MLKRFVRVNWILATSLGVLAACSGTSETEVSASQQLTIEECTSNRDARAAEAGRVGGASLVQAAWSSFNECTDFATFEQLVLDDAARLVCEGGSTYVVCRCLGMKKGMEDKLAELKTACDCTLNDAAAVEAGRVTGAALVRAAWNSFNNCAGFTTFEQIVRENTRLECAGSAYSVCRCYGLEMGVEEKLAELKTACGI